MVAIPLSPWNAARCNKLAARDTSTARRASSGFASRSISNISCSLLRHASTARGLVVDGSGLAGLSCDVVISEATVDVSPALVARTSAV